jgi:hypothetical protein
MNVGFVGAPCSGKTTSAALLFAQLKDDGVVAEFVAERARYYIAKKKYETERLDAGSDGCRGSDRPFDGRGPVPDHARAVRDAAHPASRVGDGGVVVSDASALGALSYMSEEGRASEEAARWIQAANKDTHLLFFAHPIDGYDRLDPNRIHSADQALVIHNEIPSLLARFSPAVPVIELRGDSFARKHIVLRAVYERLST